MCPSPSRTLSPSTSITSVLVSLSRSSVFLLLRLFPVLPSGLSGLAASYLSPVKALVPQMPKLLKSLFPAREDKKDLRPSLQAQQVRNLVSLFFFFLIII